MSIDKATMVKLIDGLEQRKWIVREFNASDRRVKKVTLTTSGNKILKELLELREGVERDFLSVLTKEEEKQLRAIIPKLL
jgi:DNA-binding MarR family transcriptional regulator